MRLPLQSAGTAIPSITTRPSRSTSYLHVPWHADRGCRPHDLLLTTVLNDRFGGDDADVPRDNTSTSAPLLARSARRRIGWGVQTRRRRHDLVAPTGRRSEDMHVGRSTSIPSEELLLVLRRGEIEPRRRGGIQDARAAFLRREALLRTVVGGRCSVGRGGQRRRVMIELHRLAVVGGKQVVQGGGRRTSPAHGTEEHLFRRKLFRGLVRGARHAGMRGEGMLLYYAGEKMMRFE